MARFSETKLPNRAAWLKARSGPFQVLYGEQARQAYPRRASGSCAVEADEALVNVREWRNPQPGARVPRPGLGVVVLLGKPDDPFARLPGVTPGEEHPGFLDAVVPPEHSFERSAERVHLAPREIFHADGVHASSTVQRDVVDAAERRPPCLDKHPPIVVPSQRHVNVPDHVRSVGSRHIGTGRRCGTVPDIGDNSPAPATTVPFRATFQTAARHPSRPVVLPADPAPSPT